MGQLLSQPFVVPKISNHYTFIFIKISHDPMKLVFAIFLLISAAAPSVIKWNPSSYERGFIHIPGNASLISWRAAPYISYNQGPDKTWILQNEDCTYCNL